MLAAIELVDERLLSPDGAAVTWPQARERLDRAGSYWLATIHPDGRPQVRPLLGVVLADRLYVSTSPKARKSRNLEHEPRCSVSATCQDLDIVVDGTAFRVRADAELERVCAAFRAKYGWPVTPGGGATVTAEYGAPTAGGPPYHMYGLTPATVFGFPTGNGGLGPMRWRFDAER